jgi:hypothetical protein
VRDGKPVLKSRLVPSPAAAAIGAYLRDRAAGLPRFQARARHGLEAPVTTLISVERNALTYAGHTVWNMMNEPGTGAPRYRPREEWEVKRGTHPAVITDAEAEALLARAHRPQRAMVRPAKYDYLLAGLLRTPAGGVWHGDRDRFYRHGKGRRLAMRRVDQTVVGALMEDLAGERLLELVLEHVRARANVRPDGKRGAVLRRRLGELDAKIRRLADLVATDVDAGTALAADDRGMREGALERRGRARARRARGLGGARAARDHRGRRAPGAAGIADDLAAEKDVAGLHDVVLKLLERVDVDPAAPEDVVLHYRLPPLGGVEVASPRGFDASPSDGLQRRVKLAA